MLCGDPDEKEKENIGTDTADRLLYGPSLAQH